MNPAVLALAAGPLAGTIAGLAGMRARRCGWLAIAGALVTLALATWLLIHELANQRVSGFHDFVYVDPLGAFFLFTVALVVLAASVGSATYVYVEEQRGDLSHLQTRLYFVFFGLFAAFMLASMETGNLGLVFVLIEASTLASVVLVGLEGSARSLEAAWKYVIISSLGVTIALVGTLYLFYAGSRLNLASELRLTWPYLLAHASQMSHPSLRLAFLLAVIGYGTKVGLAPMHTWLPDAHAEAPSPTSAMLSAALLNTGMYAIIRFLAIARAGLGPSYPRNVMLVFGFLSVAVGALFLVRSGNLKRLFAYSSVEHMGIIAIGFGFGGVLGLYGALLHTLNHAIAKCVLFLATGDLVLAYRSKESSEVRGVLTALPVTGGALLLGTLAVLGSPPFGPFLSELTIVRAGFSHSPAGLAFLFLALLVVAFVGLSRTVANSVTGQPPDQLTGRGSRRVRVLAGAPLVAGLTGLLILGVWIPAGLHHVLMSSIRAMS